ncbi:hypothetical protein T484DRAFT_1915038 [Baffinella frigidus]|nr:hypothetical protein T484DRAFT_1915038 [Cryptophyta sp. CCMP2293]
MCGTCDLLVQPDTGYLWSDAIATQECACESLDLAGKGITNIHRYTFQHFSGVASLNLRNNAIQAFNNNSALSFLPGLQTVDLSMNANLTCATPALGVAYLQESSS